MEEIKIGNKKSKYPIIQGGMGVGVSLHKLAGTVSKEVKEFVKQKIDLIISGAGIPKELPEYVKGSDTKIAPIVSSLRCCQLNITKEIVEYVKEVENEYNKEIPVIAAGGIWDKNDIDKFLNLGADGVQMATRFVTTYECDASDEFKNAYLNANEEDVKIINSPVGMPGRAIYNNFIKNTEKVRDTINKCYRCIKTCDVKTTPYCITKALINSVKGNVDNGLIFCGSNVFKAKEIVSVHDLMQQLVI